MILNAAHRLLASDETQQLRKFAESLSPEQRQYLLLGLPYALVWGWFGGGFDKNLKTPEIVLGSSVEVSAADYGAPQFQRFIVGMLHLRNIFPPQVPQGKIYRLTAVSQKPTDETVLFRNQEQYRSLTSWTVLPNPIVEALYKPKGTTDIVLCYKLPSAKNVLFDYLSVAEFLRVLHEDRNFYAQLVVNEEYKASFTTKLEINRKEIAHYFSEKEVALYLNAEQGIECTWRSPFRDKKAKPATPTWWSAFKSHS